MSNASPSPVPASLARRALPALVLVGGTAAFVVALDHPGGGGDLVVTAPAGAVTDVASPATTAPRAGSAATPTVPATTLPTQAIPGGREGREGREGRDGGGVTNTVPATPSTARDLSACAGAKTITGGVAQSRFGPFQAQVTVSSAGTICDVKVLQAPTDRRSTSINTQAIPAYNDAIVKAQSTKVNVISGATITWQSYLASVQSALDAR